MTLLQFIRSYHIEKGGEYECRLKKARLFVSDAMEATDSFRSYIYSNAAMLYDVYVTDI